MFDVVATSQSLGCYAQTQNVLLSISLQMGTSFTRLLWSIGHWALWLGEKTHMSWSFLIKVTSFPVPGGWMWIDNNVVDYANWRSGMPNKGSCVYINSEDGRWVTHNCERYKSYICKTAKGKWNQLFYDRSNLTHRSLIWSLYSLFFQLLHPQKNPHPLVSSQTIIFQT